MSAAWAADDSGGYVSWRLRGLCREHPAELFFPEEEPRRRIRRQRELQAKQICLECPVLAKCREYALRAPEKHGVWGAMTTRERLSIAVQAS